MDIKAYNYIGHLNEQFILEQIGLITKVEKSGPWGNLTRLKSWIDEVIGVTIGVRSLFFSSAWKKQCQRTLQVQSDPFMGLANKSCKIEMICSGSENYVSSYTFGMFNIQKIIQPKKRKFIKQPKKAHDCLLPFKKCMERK
jgi:hypothetical protein